MEVIKNDNHVGVIMRIAIFTDTFVPDVNGVARTLDRYTKFLKKNNIDYRVFAPKATKESQFSSQVLSFQSMPFLLYPECRIAFPNMLQIKEEIMEFKPDIIHVATPFNLGLCGLHFAKKYHIPLVGSYHTDFDKYLEHYHLQFLTDVLWKYLKWFHRPLEKIFVPSIDTKVRLEEHDFKNITIWPRGIDGDIFHRDYHTELVRTTYGIEEKYILLYVGRIASEKDIMLLPSIAEHLPEGIKEKVHWLVVGDGPLKEGLKTAAPDNMTLTGFIEGKELARVYAAADLFVFPSASETFGNVVLESLACGTPVIGADAGGVRNIIERGKTGLLCEEKNAMQFAQAVVSLLSNDELRVRMGEQGFQYAQAQSWETIFHRLLDNYEDVLSIDTWKLDILA